MKFDDIDLSNDKNAPKLDLDFGLPPAGGAPDKKSGGSSFGFGGGWGGGWGGTGSSWGFGATEEKAPEPKPVDDSWGFGSKTKDTKDKKKTTNTFDFDFDTLGGGEDITASAKKEEPVEEDPW